MKMMSLQTTALFGAPGDWMQCAPRTADGAYDVGDALGLAALNHAGLIGTYETFAVRKAEIAASDKFTLAGKRAELARAAKEALTQLGKHAAPLASIGRARSAARAAASDRLGRIKPTAEEKLLAAQVWRDLPRDNIRLVHLYAQSLEDGDTTVSTAIETLARSLYPHALRREQIQDAEQLRLKLLALAGD